MSFEAFLTNFTPIPKRVLSLILYILLNSRLKGVRYDLKTHPRVMKILVLTIFDVLSSEM